MHRRVNLLLSRRPDKRASVLTSSHARPGARSKLARRGGRRRVSWRDEALFYEALAHIAQAVSTIILHHKIHAGVAELTPIRQDRAWRDQVLHNLSCVLCQQLCAGARVAGSSAANGVRERRTMKGCHMTSGVVASVGKIARARLAKLLAELTPLLISPASVDRRCPSVQT